MKSGQVYPAISDENSGQSSYPYPPPPPQYSAQQNPYPPQSIVIQPQPIIGGVFPQQHIIVTNVPVANHVVLSRMPIQIKCPQCQSIVVTRITKENGATPWIFAGGLCLLGFWLGCCLIPFCIDDLKDTLHHCPNCNTYLGKKAAL